MKYLSLFSGIGGFEKGIQQAYEDKISDKRQMSEQEGLQDRRNNLLLTSEGDRKDRDKYSNDIPICVGFSEIDRYATQVYQKQFPKHHNYGDITKINEKELPDFDFLCGGFPCQSFSIAGKRGGFEDTRGTLFFDIARILREKQPSLLLLENVKGLLSHEKGDTFKTIIRTLDELGYDLQWQVLNSKNFGVPQNRERVFIIGNLRGTRRPEVFPIGEDDQETNDISGQQTNTITARYEGAQATGSYIIEGKQHAQEIEQLNKPVHSNDRVYSEKGLSPTINTMQGGNRQPFIRRDGMEVDMKVSNAVTPDAYLTSGKRKVVDGKTVLTSMCDRRIRRLTPTECMRLQGFPDDWCDIGADGKLISDCQKYKMAGNAVTVNVIKAIIMKLI